MKHVVWIVISYFCQVGQARSAVVRRPLGSGWISSNDGWLFKKKQDSFWVPAIVPGTVLVNQISSEKGPNYDPYFEDNLSKFPDLHDVPRDFYEGHYKTNFTLGSGVTWVQFRGLNWESIVHCDGRPLFPIENITSSTLLGMFHRFTFNLAQCRNAASGVVEVLVVTKPPFYAGQVGGQGGNDSAPTNIGMNAAEEQDTLGWDWVTSTPDRNTGIWDIVQTKSTPRAFTVLDPFVNTSIIWDGSVASQAVGEFHFMYYSESAGEYQVKVVIEDSQFVLLNESLSLVAGYSNAMVGIAPIQNPILWRPWRYTGKNPPSYRYNATLTVEVNGLVVEEITFRFAVRSVRAEIDTTTGGRIFFVNEERFYMRGGDWISTDQLLRYTGSSRRYYSEVLLHRMANMDIIRVWGGATTERPEFYEACDELGILVWQELWMTGDVNGAWGPNIPVRWTFPFQPAVYLSNVEDTMRQLRAHPSLLLWCAGNELSPPQKSPPPLIWAGTQEAYHQIDGSRIIVQSSMNQYGNKYAVAPRDGPYAPQPLVVYYLRNAGLGPGPWNKTQLSFNPEIGNSGVTSCSSLRRWMGPEAFASFPAAFQPVNETHPIWQFHKYEQYYYELGADKIDFVYNYGAPTSTCEFTFQAQLVNFEQYRAIIEGYTYHMFEFYTGEIIWKTQTPWPALRGNLYDWYLVPKGSFYGVRQGSATVNVQLGILITSLSAGVANSGDPLLSPCYIVVKVYNMVTGSILSTLTSPTMDVATGFTEFLKDIPVYRNGDQKLVNFYRLSLFDINGNVMSTNEYWRSSDEGLNNFTSLQALRSPAPPASVVVVVDAISEIAWYYTAAGSGRGYVMHFSLRNNGAAVAAFIEAGIVFTANTSFAIPAFINTNFFTLLPGEAIALRAEVAKDDICDPLQPAGQSPLPFTPEAGLLVSGYNVLPLFVPLKGHLKVEC